MGQQDQWMVSKPGILGGKPCLSGTRISVEFLLELLASGASPQDIRRAYPQVTEEGLAAALRSHDPDPDAGLELRPEFAEKLAREIERADRGEGGTDLETIARELAGDWTSA